MTEALGLPKGYFNNDFEEPIITLRPIHYSAEQSDVTDGVFGAGAC
jgi:isopenicillin N synthase-like dioxygenase